MPGPTNNLNVTLDTSHVPNMLNVEDSGGQNRVAANAQPTTITWHLTGVLAGGYFDPNDAFVWALNAPLNGRFGPPTVGANGNTLSIIDYHNDSTTNGTYTYWLCVHYNNTTYQTGLLNSPTATTTNPQIINH